jgi:hypothetical protein
LLFNKRDLLTDGLARNSNWSFNGTSHCIFSTVFLLANKISQLW